MPLPQWHQSDNVPSSVPVSLCLQFVYEIKDHFDKASTTLFPLWPCLSNNEIYFTDLFLSNWCFYCLFPAEYTIGSPDPNLCGQTINKSLVLKGFLLSPIYRECIRITFSVTTRSGKNKGSNTIHFPGFRSLQWRRTVSNIHLCIKTFKVL